MSSRVNLRPNLKESVSAGGESVPNAHLCDFAWILHLHMQCVENGVSFSHHQTGAKLIKDEKKYQILREYQYEQAHKANLDDDPKTGSGKENWHVRIYLSFH